MGSRQSFVSQLSAVSQLPRARTRHSCRISRDALRYSGQSPVRSDLFIATFAQNLFVRSDLFIATFAQNLFARSDQENARAAGSTKPRSPSGRRGLVPPRAR
jgi:hypothetical protein